MYEIYETKVNVLKDNDEEAAKVRASLEKKKVFLVNLMGSPGAGKTTLLLRTIEALKDRYRIGVMEADADSAVDAEKIAQTGVRTIQIHTGGSCHMDADMTAGGMERMSIDDLDLVFLENVGNLVCPAEFDVGAAVKVMILSVPEGDDKPLKYPLMFTVSDCMLINKTDTKEIFDFDEDRCREYVRKLNPDMKIIPISALHAQGIREWTDWLETEIAAWRER